jgi:Endoplasmic reticulum vesicle transporter
VLLFDNKLCKMVLVIAICKSVLLGVSADVISFVINYFFIKQTEDQCCNNCEEVQEAYKKKGWALPNIDLIDQVLYNCEI